MANHRVHAARMAAGLARALLAAPLWAQADQAAAAGDIIVTASRMGETRLQDTPLAVSAIASQAIADRGISDVQDLKAYVPSLQVSDLSGFTQLYIRGVGSNIVFVGSDPSTTIHLDGVYLARPLSYFNDFLDVERIEVLRGPQGTLYGRNSVGGTINIVSRKPSTRFTADASAEGGTYGTYGFKAYVSGPISQSGIAASIAGDVSGHGAYRDNISTGNDVEDMKSRGVRGHILFPIAGGELILRADWSRQTGALGQYPKLLRPTGIPLDDSVLGDYSRVSMNRDNRTVIENYGGAADLTLPVGDAVTIHSLTAYREFRGSVVSDADSSSLDITRTIIGDIRQHQFSQELTADVRLGPVHFVGGGYYFREHNNEPLTLNIFVADISHIQRPKVTAESYAFFGQADIDLTPTLSVTAGLRWTQDNKRFQTDDYYTFSVDADPDTAAAGPILSGIPGFSDRFFVDARRKANAFTPKFGINWRPQDGMLLYASATRGFKSGGFDTGATNQHDAETGYGPEYLWSFEVGAKTDWFDHRLRANINAFYYDYSDLQVQNYVQSGLSFGAITQNAATARVKGIEMELAGRPVEGLDLFANVNYLDAYYTDYPSAFVSLFGNFDASGKKLNNAPKWSATFGGVYSHAIGNAGTLFFGADAHVQSTVYFTAANDGLGGHGGYPEQQGSYGIVNMRAGWTDPSELWRLVVNATNLLDRQYILGTANYTAAIAGRPGRPRVVSVTLSRKF